MRDLVVALALLCACSSFQRRTGLMFAADAVTLCDTASTLYLSDDGAWDYQTPQGKSLLEANPLLGRRPSQRSLTFGWVGAVMANGVIAARAPSWLAYALFAAEIGVEAWAASGNSKWAGACGVVGQDRKLRRAP